MMRALAISLAALPAPLAAQPVACAFTLVCAPEIECERHEGIPFEIDFEGGVWSVELDRETLEATPLGTDPLRLGFASAEAALLFTLDGDEGALSRHERGPARLAVATFTGPCVTG
jgi:hypothetical protein